MARNALFTRIPPILGSSRNGPNPVIGESDSAPTHSVILLRNPWLCVPLDILPYTSKERYNVRAYHHKDGAIQE
jgi:hypothetical protein